MSSAANAARKEDDVAAAKGVSYAASLNPLVAVLPGLALTFGLAALAFFARAQIGIASLSPLILSIVFGMLVSNTVGAPAIAKPGITFSLKRILRFAIILLGLQLTVTQIIEVGGTGAAIIVATLVATFFFTKAMGRVLGVDRRLAELIAAGTSICGASAVIATNLVTRGSDEDVAYAVACVTVFGSLSMILYPVIQTGLMLDPTAYGLWTGATIHEVAQVVAAAFQGGDAAGQFGTIAKLSRVALLAPLILSLGFLAARGRTAEEGEMAGKPPVPWFVFGFLALVVVNSLVTIPADIHGALVLATTFLLSAALAAMGLETNVFKLKAKGLRPLALGAIAWLFISCLGLGLILMAGL
ncbi:YeiH family protein [Aurantimonas sp. VKM B-3413]|uniref:YeiH family protein n=1 Tax=Aurantimonas sp. VKM B-3413 TaxID=2779401 RepID=UPI001E527002|nr:YeiH family protein [Aurantimonas sp. VKM B-3413]MCB8838150.1 YeiH family protein [Aurantimonas sp. VKM B-3413]